MKVPTIISKIFTNKYFLYLMIFLSFTNIIGYIILSNINAIIYFILIGLAVSIFSRNLSLVLFISLIITNLIIVNQTKEGFEDKENKKEVSKEKKEEKDKMDLNVDLAPSHDEELHPSSEPDGFSGGNKLTGSKVDYASTVEHAYDNLHKILGSESMNRLTEDTKELIKKQQMLAESMQSMTPLIQNIAPLLNQTKDMLGNMNMGNIDQIASLLTNFTGAKN
jgi:hypothetical protein